MKIANLDYDNWTEEQLTALETHGEIVDASQWTQADLVALVGEYDGLIIGLTVRIDRELLKKTAKLKFVATPTTGLTHVDMAALAERHIAVLSLSKVTHKLTNVTGTAEIALGLMIALTREIPAAIMSVHDGTWQRPSEAGHELSGKTLGIIGYGRLGRWMGRYGLALNMKVLAYDPFLDNDAFPAEIERCELLKLLNHADVVSVHASLNSTSRNLLNAEAFSHLKTTAYLINTARGEIIDEAALLKSLEEGRLAGASLDVLANEEQFLDVPELAKNHPLITYARDNNNLLLTPHLGGWTTEGTYKARGVLLGVIQEYLGINRQTARRQTHIDRQ